MVLASEDVAQSRSGKVVYVRGVGWANDSPTLETRDWGRAVYAERAAEMAYRTAGITNPADEIDFAEVDDTFAYKELQHLEALRLYERGHAGRKTQDGETQSDGRLPVNVSGGSLGMGHLLEATGLARALEVVLQLRGEAGARQLPQAHVGVAQSWRGVPTTSGAAVIMSR
jgi:acetyl-CoA C-acetyltransferase